MDIFNIKSAAGAILLTIFGIVMYSTTASAAADSLSVSTPVQSQNQPAYKPEATPFADRIAIRTNALDWMLTIPNISFEADLSGSEYNNLTLGLSAKYNWDTWHYNRNTGRPYAPPAAYNLLDIRPEVRYWYRTRKAPRTKGPWSVENFLKNRKSPKTWRANYVGAYVNYATYTFKFGKKGMQGMAYGLGASTGYSIPMYEYKNGAVDVELGFSVGLQLCTRDMFLHNPDGYFYTQVMEGTKDLHLTPFPVVSDMRVAFVWRHKSIKDKVKEDVEKNRVVRAYNMIEGDYSYDSYTKEWYDENLTNTKSSREKAQIMASDSLYLSGFMVELDKQEEQFNSQVPMAFSDEFNTDPRVHAIVMEYEEKLYKLIAKRKKDAIRKFEKEWSEHKSEKAKAEADAKKAAEKDAPKEEKVKPQKQDKEKKADDPKPEKQKKVKEEKPVKEKKNKKTETEE